MEDYPKTLAEFESRFSSEEACRDYVARIRWPKGFRCPRCENDKAWPTGRVLLQCSNCGYQASTTAGTVFDKTRKPLAQWLRAIWWLAGRRSEANALELKAFLGLGSYQTAWTWLHKLRRAMVRPGREKLLGVVEAEALLVRRSAELDPGPQTLVAIAVEATGRRATGRIRMRRVADATRKSLEPFIASSVEAGSTVHTSARDGFAGLGTVGYKHRVGRARTPSADGDAAPPRVARVARMLREWLLRAHQGAVSPEHLDPYLDEFTFWFNRRAISGQGRLFYRLLRQALLAEPLPYKNVVGHRQRSRAQKRQGGPDGKQDLNG